MPNVFKALSDPIFRQDMKRGVMDALNRGMVAGGLGAPVDLATMALRPFGYSVEKPVGGSEWIGDKMRQAGMVSDQRNALAEAAAGMLAPTGYADPIATGRAVAGLVGMAQTMGPAQKAATVYHGTPHKFDKFDSSKIGTGEGAQVYGHGIYVASSPSVAKWYADTLGQDVSKYTGKYSLETKDGTLLADAASAYQANANGAIGSDIAGRLADIIAEKISSGMSQAKAISSAKALMKKRASGPLPIDKAISQHGMAFLDSLGAVDNPKKNFYKIDLPDEKIAQMIDWDVPLSKQPKEVADRLYARGFTEDMTGEQVIKALSSDGGPAGASKILRSIGVPGVKYLDGPSRARGVGTSNFVVFPGEENILKILSRNDMDIK